ncbi:hemolysin family protein [Microbacterium amylolyticum]|uniref:CBS domain containing-hemolysin-like protein n=1 Tax=Microbacterium amylolyticum TaxID=936337 RepID=A0ABS4ZFT1_9MICO|nr:hemolysin family protein [Microbacterium amylolyticum]MBP2435863.1 CBS domain containing-hemolysin-like protein [Microbacterium amylolyticum]
MIIAALILILGILTTLAIVAANGFFVAQEFAYMSVDRSRLRALAASGDEAAARALKVTRRTSFMLSGAQLGITVTGLLVGFVAQPMIGASLGTLLGGTGIPVAVSVTVGTVLALAAATIVQMIFGELYPKNLAIASPEPLARQLSRPTLVYLAMFGWLIWVFDKSANALLALLRIEPVHDIETNASPEELRRAVAESRDSGHLPGELSLILDRVIEFPEQDVEHAMVPRSRVDFVPADLPVAELRRTMAAGHSRYPVLDPSGQPVGVVELTALLRRTPGPSDTAADLMREPVIIPTLMSLPEALHQLRHAKQQLACVIDEYGGFAGILTAEDLAEELVGELEDEHDVRAHEQTLSIGGDAWLMDGDLHVDELRRIIGHDLPPGDFETLSGLVIAEKKALPRAGDQLRIPLPLEPIDYVAETPVRRYLEVMILDLVRRVPGKVRLRIVEDEAPEDTEGDAR